MFVVVERKACKVVRNDMYVACFGCELLCKAFDGSAFGGLSNYGVAFDGC